MSQKHLAPPSFRAMPRLVLGTGLVLAVACGGEETLARQGGGADGAPKPPVVAVEAPKFVPNEHWEKVKPFFLGRGGEGGGDVKPSEEKAAGGFVRNGVQTLRDPFESQVHKYVPRVDPGPYTEPDPAAPPEKPTTDPDETGPVGVDVEPPTDLERFRAQDYRLTVIRWGTSVNKAVLLDPEGQSWVVAKDMIIGNRKGRIVDITRYDVVIQEDTSSTPIVLSIQPDLLKTQPEERSTDRLFINTGGAR